MRYRKNATPTRLIGLLGGSFNPAHAGHLHISVAAMKRYALAEVWWLVSPANPLKDPDTLAPYALRLEHARRTARHPRIRVLDCERKFATRYTIDTLRRLMQANPGCRFVWLMGMDNLAGFHRWRQWREIAALVPLVIADRRPGTYGALKSKAATALQSWRRMAPGEAPCWSALFLRPHPASATGLRKTLGKDAFSRHNGNWQPIQEISPSLPTPSRGVRI